MDIVPLKKRIFTDGSPLRFKLHLITSTQGIPTHYVLAPASHHDVTIAPEFLESYKNNILLIGTKAMLDYKKTQ
jgi:Transposase DDE domain